MAQLKGILSTLGLLSLLIFSIYLNGILPQSWEIFRIIFALLPVVLAIIILWKFI